MELLLDRARSKILSTTLRIGWLGSIYRVRAYRTFLLFSLSLAASLILASINAKILLYLSPLLLGLPHLFASYLYSSPHPETVRNFRFLLVTAAVAIWSGLRILKPEVDTQAYFIPASIFISIFVLRSKLNASRAITILALVLVPLSYFFAWEVALSLLIGHNIISFIFWHQSARTRTERNTIWAAAITTSTALGLMTYFMTAESSLVSSLQETSLIMLGGISKADCIIMLTFLVTQSLHYFIWIKAIPDFKNTADTPGGFQYSFERLRAQFGKHTIVTIGVGIAALTAVVLFIDFETFRLLYISIAAYHGLYEIGALFNFGNADQ